MNGYEINNNTLVILPVTITTCKVIEIENEYAINEDAFSIVKRSCEFFGSSYKGRHEGTKSLLGITHKSPIVIEETSKLIFFPTASPLTERCIWVSLHHVKHYYKKNDISSVIEFDTGDKLEVDVTIGSLTNQILRATRLLVVLTERIKKIN